MKTSRIDLIALNGGDGAHYKYEEVAEKLFNEFQSYVDYNLHKSLKKDIVKILVENFDDNGT